MTGERDFDLLLQYYGREPGRYAEGVDHYHVDEVNDLRTFSAVHRLLTEHPRYLDDYDCFFFPDDDIETDAATISALFAVHRELGFGISQPALTTDSYFSHSMTLAHPGLSARQVNFVEVMCPILSKPALLRCLPTFTQSVTSWGLDWVWQTLLPGVGQRAGIIDCLPVRHSRPVGGGDNYLGLAESPFEEGRRVCADHGVHLGQQMRVERAWDLDFQPLPTRSMAQQLLLTLPRPNRQGNAPGDGYADALRWHARLVRSGWAAGAPRGAQASDTPRRMCILRSVGLPLGEPVAPSGWSPEELELTRASHAAHAAGSGWLNHPERGCDPGPESDELVGTLLGAALTRSAESGQPLTVALAAHDPEVLSAICAGAGSGVRIVVCVDVGEDGASTVDRILAAVRAAGLSEDDIDVEVREQVPDPGQELGVDVVLRRARAPWKPGFPVALDPLSFEDLLDVFGRFRGVVEQRRAGAESTASASLGVAVPAY